MRTKAWLVVSVVVLSSSVGRASEPVTPSGRGALSVAGLVLGALGLGGFGLGVGGLVALGDLDVVTNPYLPVGRDESNVVRLLIDRHDQATRSAVIGFAAGGALLVTSAIFLLVDTSKGPVVSIVPVREGALVALSLRFN